MVWTNSEYMSGGIDKVLKTSGVWKTPQKSPGFAADNSSNNS